MKKEILKKKNDILKDEIREWLTTEGGQAPTADELNQTEEALIAFAGEHALATPPPLRDMVLSKINTLNKHKKNRQSLNLDNLPLLDESSNLLDWQEVVHAITPPEDYENVYLHPIESNEKRELYVAWVKEYVDEEVHYDLLESFLILEGSCECHITDEAGNMRIVRMHQGDFISMKTGETHDIRITSAEPTKAILQWLKLAV